MYALEDNLPDEMREHYEDLARLREMVEEPPEGVDVAANVETYVDTATKDLVLAAALYLRDVIEPADEAAKATRAKILNNAKRLRAERKWLREIMGEMLRRMGVDRIRGATISVSATAGQDHVEMEEGIDLDLVDERFVRRLPPEPRLDEIKAELQAGRPVFGFRLVKRPGVQIR